MKPNVKSNMMAGAVLAMLALASGCGVKSAGNGYDIVVSPEGEVKTPQAALDIVREMRAKGEIGPDRKVRIGFESAVFELEKELVIDKGIGPVELKSIQGFTVFSGGRRLTDITVDADGKLWRVKVPEGIEFEQLYVDGDRVPIAREPNEFYHYVLGEAGEEKNPKTGEIEDLSRRAVTVEPKVMKFFKGLTERQIREAMIHVWWAWDTEWKRPEFVDAERNRIYVSKPYSRSFFMWPKYCPRVTIENLPTAIDMPGEWYFDREKRELAYYARPGENPSYTVIIAPVLKRLVHVKGTEDVTVDGITFQHNGWVMPKDGFYGSQSAYFADAALEIAESKRVVFQNCKFEHTANYGIWFTDRTSDSVIRHSWFEDIGAGGVRVGSRNWSAKTPDDVVSRITVDDNVICRGGKVTPAGTAIFCTFMRDSVITHNDVCDMYYSGICSGFRWGYMAHPNHNNEISWNRFRNLGKGVLSDMGYIYTLGDHRGTVVKGNYGEDMYSYGYTGSGGTGLYPDEGSRGVLYISNLVYHTKTSALSQHYGRDNVFKNNIFAFNTKPGSPIAGRWRPEQHCSLVVSNNIFCYGKEQKGWKGALGSTGKGPVNDLVFGENLWWCPDGKRADDFNGGTFEDWQKNVDKGAVFADPKFRNWKKGDFRLDEDSPAFKFGFKEWDYSLSGVRWDDKLWRARTELIMPEELKIAPVPPENPGRKNISSRFEGTKTGRAPTGVFSDSMGDVAVSEECARTGKKSVKFTDSAGQSHRFMPHSFTRFSFAGSSVEIRFSFRSDDKADIAFTTREYSTKARNGSYADGADVVVKDGALFLSTGKGMLKADNFAAGKWMDVAITLHPQSNVAPTWDCRIVNEDGKAFERKGLTHPGTDCSRPNWFGVISWADRQTVTYFDDFSIESK